MLIVTMLVTILNARGDHGGHSGHSHSHHTVVHYYYNSHYGKVVRDDTATGIGSFCIIIIICVILIPIVIIKLVCCPNNSNNN